jgi:formylglycine-generating enzyme required for sulfatase activity
MTTPVRTTRDAYIGLDDATPPQWEAWHRAMLEERDAVRARARLDVSTDRDAATAWSRTALRQFFLFMYDVSFYDRAARRYRTTELVDAWTARFGRVDSVLLWHAYPRLGFDSRTQFDFYREMPGGLAQLRAEVTDVLHARGLRVFVDYNPWDTGTYEELAEIVAGLDADGVMLDTMTDAPERLASVVEARRGGVIFVPELRPADADLGRLRQSWAQWLDIGDATTPSIYRHRWIDPRHGQLAIRRWDTARKPDIVYSFFNGAGLVLWDNVFGTWNPYSRQDRRLIAETAAVFDHYEDLLVDGEWLPLIPTGVAGLDANRWNARGDGDRRGLVTLRNRTAEARHWRVPADAPPGLVYVALWGEGRPLAAGDRVAVEPGGTQAVALDEPARSARAVEHLRAVSRRADVASPDYDERCPPARPVPVARGPGHPAAATPPSGSMIEMPAGTFDMKLRHERRECGCYPAGGPGANADANAWGWFYTDVVTHEHRAVVRPFAMRATAVTNADFVAFVHAARYRPQDDQSFLKHIDRRSDGRLPDEIPGELGALPVTYVSLDDARAYAAWHGQRLPTEVEWQWAAEGAGAGNRYPWGNEARPVQGAIRPAFDPSTATRQGVMGLSGNPWELTDSELTDGHTRFVMLRGGVFLPPGASEWLPARGARPNDSHAKYLLLGDGLDRSGSVSFRTVADLA